MLRRLVLAWTQVRDVLSSREFWLILALSLLLLTLLSVLLWLAIEQYDTYLRLRSLVCPQGLGNNQLLVIAIVSPLCAAFTLGALGEFVAQIRNRRGRGLRRWNYFGLFAGLMLLTDGIILAALRC